MSYLLNSDLSVKCYDNAIAFPPEFKSGCDYRRGVLDSDGNVIPESVLFEVYIPEWDKRIPESESVKEIDTAIYLGWMEPQWGHAITDSLKKLWFLHTEECKNLLANGARLVSIRPWESEQVNQLFSLLGIDITKIENIRKVTRFKKLYIPDNSIKTFPGEQRYYTMEYSEIIKAICDFIPRTTSIGKIYLSRTAFTKNKKWRERGEESIERVFRQLGYKIVFPEQLSVIESLTLIRNCDAFASTEGSISHNAVFCKECTPVTIIRKVDSPNTWQLMLNEVAQLNVTYLNGHQSIVSKGYLGPFYLCVTPELQRYVGHYIPHIPHWLRPTFWWYLVQNRKLVKRVLNIIGYKYE